MIMRDSFITGDFMLQSKAARRLYHEYAADMPIIDYHCHLPTEDIATDRSWENLTQLWLDGEHYKWRAMRSNGVEERFCTGTAPDREKFEKWAATMPYLLRNPLYHWTHMELKKYFDISDRLLSPKTADGIWNECNSRLSTPEFRCRNLILRSNVALICTTDDPVDSLDHHRALANDPSFHVPVLPAWRPDRGMAVDDPKLFNNWLDRLAEVSNIEIRDFDSYMEAIRNRHDFFHECGCRLSDHGLETAYAAEYTQGEINSIFDKARGGARANEEENAKFKSAMLYEFGVLDHEKNWTQQFHLGAMRNNNSRMAAALGPDKGFDSIANPVDAAALSGMLDKQASAGKLTRTILYNLNPADNAMIATMIGNFQDGCVPGKMQFGSGWWFMDQKRGMEDQIEALSQMGLLSRFVGMLTDSRSFISYTRHEYFRRVLCNILGNDMEAGLIPFDMELVGGMVRDISYNNAASYFGFDLPKEEGK